MALRPGQYYIYTSKGVPVGRFPHEETSTRPKPVFRLPPHIKAPTWSIEHVSHDRYILSTKHAYTAQIDKKVFAILLEEPKPVKWEIKLREQHGPNIYTIVEPSGEDEPEKGWVVPLELEEEQGAQIEIRPLITTRSLPPFYLPNEIFRIEKAED